MFVKRSVFSFDPKNGSCFSFSTFENKPTFLLAVEYSASACLTRFPAYLLAPNFMPAPPIPPKAAPLNAFPITSKSP